VHLDVAENDFSTLFEVVENAPETYLSDDPNVFPSAVGRSFYRPVLPSGQVHLGWSSYAAVWLSPAPTTIPGHFWISSTSGEVRAAFERQAAEDWRAFLRLRSQELRPGGRLVVTLPSPPEDGQSRIHTSMNHANAVVANKIQPATNGPRGRQQPGNNPRGGRVGWYGALVLCPQPKARRTWSRA
jgi:hypothetical protein